MHSHLTMNDRLVIARLFKKDFTYSAIARIIGVHHTTIGREIRRNARKNYYSANNAQKQTSQRRKDAKEYTRKIENYSFLKKYVQDSLKNYLSPEQISGKLKQYNIFVSHPTIYSYLYRSYPKGKIYLRHKK